MNTLSTQAKYPESLKDKIRLFSTYVSQTTTIVDKTHVKWLAKKLMAQIELKMIYQVMRSVVDRNRGI
jgi:hypothetical protein